MAPPVIVTEDTPPDMLAGSMDLTVVLPDRHSSLNMSVQRSTPMMDLLVQVTTANKLSPAGYIIQPLNERGSLPYKPSTPIGALDAWTIHVVPKHLSQCAGVKRLNQPFEQTFRLQVHLPRNQLYVVRVSPKTRLSDILLQVCNEKNLDPLKYSLRHPGNLDQVLSLPCTLADYKLQELTLVCNRTHPVQVSTVDIMSLQRDPANLAYRNNKCEGSVSSGSLEGRSLSPVPSDESSASPPPLPPSRPTRKRRPAPKPPTSNPKIVNEEKRVNGIQTTKVVNHSRNSSDSSGYHEASVLSESPQSNSVPGLLAANRLVSEEVVSKKLAMSQSMTDVSVIQRPLQQATSYNSLSSMTGRKKKAAPPPPMVIQSRASEAKPRTPSVSSTASSTTTLDGNDVNVTTKSATLPPSSRLNTVPPPSSPAPITPVDVESPITSQGSDMNLSYLRMADEEIDRIFKNATENHCDLEDQLTNPVPNLPSPMSSSPTQHDVAGSLQEEDTMDWEYRLLAPPTFRDDAKSPTVTEFKRITLGNFSDDLETEDRTQNTGSDVETPDSCGTGHTKSSDISTSEMKPISSVLTDDVSPANETFRENNSFKSKSFKKSIVKIDNSTKEDLKKIVVNDLTCKFSKIKSTRNENDNVKTQPNRRLSKSSTLDNFTITTYKDKKPLEVFEDDSIKSSVGEKRDRSKDDAVFRAPKPRVKEPNLSRTSSFSMENKLNGSVIKRSVSYVSLMAANMPRHSQPYRAHLTDTMWPQLRKTTSELNIDMKDNTLERLSWQSQDKTSELQSVQVLRNILSLSQANLSSSADQPDSLSQPEEQRSSQDPVEQAAATTSEGAKWERSQSQDETRPTSKWTLTNKFEHTVSLDEGYSSTANTHKGAPAINLSTWSERPKQHISIKDDGDYRFGFGKKRSWQDEAIRRDLPNNSVETSNGDDSLKGNIMVGKTSEGLTLEGNSKSVSDFSRIPVVTAVELKKSYTAASALTTFSQLKTKPLSLPEKTDTDDHQDNNSFIGVNSLARKFGVPNKRPTSMYDNFTGQNFLKATTKEDKPEIVNRANTLERNIFSNFRTEEINKGKDNVRSVGPSEFTSEIKAQAKIRSGGFVKVTTDLLSPQLNFSLSRAKSLSTTNLKITGLSEFNSISNEMQSLTSNPKASNIRFTVNQGPIRQVQILNKTARPAYLHPVVKGFTRVNINPTTSCFKNTVEILSDTDNSSLSSNISNGGTSQTCLNKTVSITSLGRENSSAETTMVLKGQAGKSTCTAPAPPPPVPLLTSLKHVGERKGIKYFPQLVTDPRDLLMSSIRSFKKQDLKSSK